ncbi:MAG TPA: hypothetical protein VF175_06960, partial [Lacipirellula sp.]
VEYALAIMRTDPNWRTTYAHGVEYPTSSWISYGQRSRFKLALLDVSDNNLTNEPNDAVTIRGVGSAGNAVCITTVSVEPGTRALNCLDCSLHSNNRLYADNQSTLTTNQMVSSNARIDINPGLLGLGLLGSSKIDGDAWSTGPIDSGGVTGASYPNQSSRREMPDSATAFEYYLAVGTRIKRSSLVSGNFQGVLSATSNPYGPVNPQGIYVIDCSGLSVRIDSSQIRGTLVIINSSDVRTIGTLDWAPAAANYPVLMVGGPLRMDHSGTISGLVYVTGNLSVTRSSTINGIVVVAGTATTTTNLNVNYNSTPRDIPPPGFGAGPAMRVVPGTWRRTTAN